MSNTKNASNSPKHPLQAILLGSPQNPLQRALWLETLNQKLQLQLPKALAQHCKLANINAQHQLVLLTDSPLWRSQLRLHEAVLLSTARELGLKVKSVVVKISIQPLQPVLTAPQKRSVSPVAKKALQMAITLLDTPTAHSSQKKIPPQNV